MLTGVDAVIDSLELDSMSEYLNQEVSTLVDETLKEQTTVEQAMDFIRLVYSGVSGVEWPFKFMVANELASAIEKENGTTS